MNPTDIFVHKYLYNCKFCCTFAENSINVPKT